MENITLRIFDYRDENGILQTCDGLYINNNQPSPAIDLTQNFDEGFSEELFLKHLLPNFREGELRNLNDPNTIRSFGKINYIFHESTGYKEKQASASLFLRMLAIPETTPNLFINIPMDVYHVSYCNPYHNVKLEGGQTYYPLGGIKTRIVKLKNQRVEKDYTVVYELVGIGYHTGDTSYNLVYNNNAILGNKVDF